MARFNKRTWINNTSPAINSDNLNGLEADIQSFGDDIVNELASAINVLVVLPIGAGVDYFGSTAPDNFLFADGSAISRTDYAELFAVIGTTYGVGDGSTTFNLPDKRERVSVMYKEGSTNGTDEATLGTLGAKGGEFKHTQTVDEMPKHNHNNVMVTGFNVAVNGTGSGNFLGSESGFATGKDGANMYTSQTGSGEAFNVMQPYLVCNFIIRVK